MKHPIGALSRAVTPNFTPQNCMARGVKLNDAQCELYAMVDSSPETKYSKYDLNGVNLDECPAGTFYNQGAPICYPCFKDTYNNKAGSNDCTYCETPNVTNPEHTSCSMPASNQSTTSSDLDKSYIENIANNHENTSNNMSASNQHRTSSDLDSKPYFSDLSNRKSTKDKETYFQKPPPVSTWKNYAAAAALSIPSFVARIR